MSDKCISCRSEIRCPDGTRVVGSCLAHFACCCTCGYEPYTYCIIVRKDCADLSIYVTRFCKGY